MKRFLTRLSAVAMALTMVMACSKENAGNGDYINAIPENATAIMYIDGYQMMQKTELLDQFKTIRQIAAKQAPNLVGKANADFVESIILDLDNTGIATTEPIYAAVTAKSTDDAEIVVLAKVCDKGKLDRLVALANENGAGLEIENTDGCTIVLNEDGACIAYNDAAIVIAGESDSNYRQLAINTLKSAYTPRTTALPDFKNYDIGVYVDTRKLLELGVKADRDFAAQYEQYINTDMFGDGVISGLTFNPGHILLDCNIIGMSDEMKARFESAYSNKVTNEYLKYLPVDTYVVLSSYFNGKQTWDMIMDMPMVKDQLEQAKQYTTEEEWQESMDMANKVFDSFDGDVVMALNRIGNSYGDTDIKASAIMTVNNDYIISLFEMYKAIFGDTITQTGNNAYCADLGDMTAYFGQQGSMLYASTEGVPAPVSRSAADAAWVSDIDTARFFMVVNLRKIFADPLVNTMMWREVYNDRTAGDVARSLINLLDYAYMRDVDFNSSILDIVLLNRTDNALKQIVDAIQPAVMQNVDLNALF